MKSRLRQKCQALSGPLYVWRAVCFGSVLMATAVGCGGSDSSNSSVVPPPAPLVVESGDAVNSEPPGSIELPAGVPLPTSQDDPKSDGGIQMPANVELPIDSGASSGSKVKYGTWDEIQAVAKSSGRITVVDLWSLACEPCLKEFPGLVRLHQTLGSSVQCIAVDLDFDGRKTRPPEHYEQDVIAFLESVGSPDFPTYISQTPNEDVYAAAKLASIPAVLIYNADGQIVKVFVDTGDSVGFSYEKDIIPLVTKLAG